MDNDKTGRMFEVMREELWKELRAKGIEDLTAFWTMTFTGNDRKRQFEMAFFKASLNTLVRMFEAEMREIVGGKK